MELGPRGTETTTDVGEEPVQRRLLVQRERVEHLRLEHAAAGDAHQLEAPIWPAQLAVRAMALVY
jgi:hypothetical protein